MIYKIKVNDNEYKIFISDQFKIPPQRFFDIWTNDMNNNLFSGRIINNIIFWGSDTRVSVPESIKNYCEKFIKNIAFI